MHHLKEGQPGDAEVRLTRVSGDPETPFRIYVTDTISGMEAVEVRLDCEQLANLISGRAAEATGVRWRGLDKVGKREEIMSERFGFGAENAEAAREIAEAWESQGYSIEVREQNYGVTVIGRRWNMEGES